MNKFHFYATAFAIIVVATAASIYASPDFMAGSLITAAMAAFVVVAGEELGAAADRFGPGFARYWADRKLRRAEARWYRIRQAEVLNGRDGWSIQRERRAWGKVQAAFNARQALGD